MKGREKAAHRNEITMRKVKSKKMGDYGDIGIANPTSKISDQINIRPQDGSQFQKSKAPRQ